MKKQLQTTKKDVKKDLNFNRQDSAWKILLLVDLGKTYSGEMNKKVIMSKYGIKHRSGLYYHTKQFIEAGLLEQHGKYPTTYALTPLAKSVVKNIIAPSEGVDKGKPIYRFHYYIRGYDVNFWGNYKFNSKNKTPMHGGWSYQRHKERYGKGIINVQVNDTGKIMIYAPHVYGTDVDNLKVRAMRICDDIALKIASRYGMEISEGYDIRGKKGHKPHYSIVESQKLASLLINVKDPRFWVDFSQGTGELETQEPRYIKNLLDVPEQINNLSEQLKEVRAYAYEIKEHRAAISEMKEAVKELRDIMKKIGDKL